MGFTVVVAAPRQRTTPPHKAVVRAEAPSPPTTWNSFAALLLEASPTPSDDENPTPNDDPTRQPTPHLPLPTTAPQADPRICTQCFLDTFLESWPEDLVTNDSSPRI